MLLFRFYQPKQIPILLATKALRFEDDKETNTVYHAYFHANISLYNNGKPPCSIWVNSVLEDNIILIIGI